MNNVNNLLDPAINGDKSAEKQIYEFLFLRFTALAKRRITEKQDAEDLAQEACMTVLQKYRDETFIKGFEAWTYGILRMKIGNYLQKKKVRENTIASDFQTDRDSRLSSPEPDYDLRLNLADCLKKIIRGGFVRYARALNLIHKGFKVPEICQKLNVNANHFYVILKRGRSMLKVCLETGRI
jgi:RNA polymerase sigma factor (sigma-70 family)